MIKNKEEKYRISFKEYLPQKFEEIIIACHGFGGDKESSAIELLSKAANKKNIGVIAFDFPAHGESEVEGDFLTLDNCISDLETVEEYVKENYKNVKKIDIFATSYGAYITLLKIIKNDCNYNKIILRALAIEMGNIFKDYLLGEDIKEFLERGFAILGFERKIKITEEFYLELEKNKIIELYNKGKEMLIIQGDEDNVAPIKDTISFVNNNITLKILRGADHRMKKEGELETVVEWSLKYINE